MNPTFNDVLIRPQWSTVNSRKTPDISSKFSRNLKINTPFVSANMRTVTDANMCMAMQIAQGMGVLHRYFDTLEKWKEEINTINGNKWGLSIGIRQDWKEILNYTFNSPGIARPLAVVLDVANAANDLTLTHTKDLVEYRDNLYHTDANKWFDVVVGNIATADAAAKYKQTGIDGIKVGIGPGAACTTRIITGIGVPQLHAIREVSRVLKRSDIRIIADGGISQPGHACIALAAGADTVMMGKVLSYAAESPGWVCTKNERYVETEVHWSKTYQGEASFRETAHEGVKHTLSLPQGMAPKTVEEILEDYKWGLRTAMAYTNSLNLEHFQENAVLEEVTYHTLAENNPR